MLNKYQREKYFDIAEKLCKSVVKTIVSRFITNYFGSNDVIDEHTRD